MSGRVIQGFFVGGAIRIPGTTLGPAATVGSAPRRDSPGPPQLSFAGHADAVQRRAATGRPPSARPRTAVAQRFGGDRSVPVDPVQLGLARGGGRPLPSALLAKMEAAFASDFSNVRIHVGPEAGRIGAVAFTTGRDIYFAHGMFQPDTHSGQQLIGHELAHVVQQSQGRVRPQGPGVTIVQDRALEAEADRLGMRAAAFKAPPIRALANGRPGGSRNQPGPIQCAAAKKPAKMSPASNADIDKVNVSATDTGPPSKKGPKGIELIYLKKPFTAGSFGSDNHAEMNLLAQLGVDLGDRYLVATGKPKQVIKFSINAWPCTDLCLPALRKFAIEHNVQFDIEVTQDNSSCSMEYKKLGIKIGSGGNLVIN